MTDFVLDLGRRERIGLPEAIYCENKTADQIVAIVEAGLEEQEALLLTRLSETAFNKIASRLPGRADYETLSGTAIVGDWTEPETEPLVALVSAGTSDLSVAREAGRTLAFAGVATEAFTDIGVAGLWRLTDRIEEIRAYPVILAFAGMEGALFSVLAGLVPGVVIAVPTSIGYGVGAGGQTALGTALASCAPGVVVTNIDNGYGAACAALRVLALEDLRSSRTQGARPVSA